MGLFSRTLSRLDELKRALTKDPASRQFLALADELRRQGQVPEAIAVLESGLAQDPTSVAGHVALGRLLQHAGRGEDAIASFQTALRIDPQNLVALRQTADLFLSKGDKVEAIKKLKLFRGLSPGDREVNEIIRQLDDELGATAAPRAPARFPSGAVSPLPANDAAYPPPVPPSPFATGEVVIAPSLASPLAVAPALDREGAAAFSAPLPIEADGVPVEVLPEPQYGYQEPAEAVDAPRANVPFVPPADASSVPGTVADGPSGTEGVFAVARETDRIAPPPPALTAASPAGGDGPGVPGLPATTETLAALLRAQGHLAESEAAYRDLASREPDAARAARLRSVVAGIAAERVATPRGRLEAWAAPFARILGARETDLVTAVEEIVRRIEGASAVVTDLEGVPVVSVGPRADAEAMENLAAELTAFWKNVRRSRAEIGEGALDGLVLSGSEGTAVVKMITPSYALLVRTGGGLPSGRLRFEAARAAEQLRPALV